MVDKFVKSWKLSSKSIMDPCSYLLDKCFPDDTFLENGLTCPPPILEQELKIAHSISPFNPTWPMGGAGPAPPGHFLPPKAEKFLYLSKFC